MLSILFIAFIIFVFVKETMQCVKLLRKECEKEPVEVDNVLIILIGYIISLVLIGIFICAGLQVEDIVHSLLNACTQKGVN